MQMPENESVNEESKFHLTIFFRKYLVRILIKVAFLDLIYIYSSGSLRENDRANMHK
jgi:hypothetical protein